MEIWASFPSKSPEKTALLFLQISLLSITKPRNAFRATPSFYGILKLSFLTEISTAKHNLTMHKVSLGLSIFSVAISETLLELFLHLYHCVTGGS